MRRLADRWLPWAAAAVLAAGIIFFVVNRLGAGSSTPTPARAVPLSAAARQTAQKFVETAVARRRLGDSYTLVAEPLKQHMSRAEWERGTIPVVPYPVGQAVEHVKVKSSYSDHALLTVSFAPRPATDARAQSFALSLVRQDGRWLVDGWEPTSVVRPPRGG